jgi:hypothetical protein
MSAALRLRDGDRIARGEGLLQRLIEQMLDVFARLLRKRLLRLHSHLVQ